MHATFSVLMLNATLPFAVAKIAKSPEMRRREMSESAH